MICLLMMLLASLTSILSGGESALADAFELEKGTLQFTYASRSGVEGTADCLRVRFPGAADRQIYLRGRYDEDDEYAPGPVTVRCRLRRGEVGKLEFCVLPEDEKRPRADRDLGDVPVADAVAFFLRLAGESDEDVAEDAVLGAAIAREAEVVDPFLRLVREHRASDGAREQALFWLAVLAGEKAVEPIRGLIDDDAENTELRCHAVFALAQLEQEKAFPLLMEIAREHEHPEIQRSAFIWLADFDRPEVVDLFENILVTR